VIARRLLMATLALCAVAACDDGDDATTTSTDPAVTEPTATAPSEPTATTDEPTAPPTTEPSTTTAPGPTTSPEDALRAEIAADYLEASDRYFELVNQPSLDNLAERAKAAAADGSEYYATVVAEVEDLVRLGDRIVPNDPDIRRIDIEAVELAGAEPWSEALVTVCLVTNAKQVTPPENSPNGQETLTLGTGELVAIRQQELVVLTEQGWLPTQAAVEAMGIWEGSEQCGPA
jgi:hypothetical protein